MGYDRLVNDSKFNVGSLEPYKPIIRIPINKKIELPAVYKIHFVTEYKPFFPPPPHR